MGGCADREIRIEQESEKELRAKMVIEYLKQKTETNTFRSTSSGIPGRPLGGRPLKRPGPLIEIDSSSSDLPTRTKSPGLDLKPLASPKPPPSFSTLASQRASEFSLSKSSLLLGNAILSSQSNSKVESIPIVKEEKNPSIKSSEPKNDSKKEPRFGKLTMIKSDDEISFSKDSDEIKNLSQDKFEEKNEPLFFTNPSQNSNHSNNLVFSSKPSFFGSGDITFDRKASFLTENKLGGVTINSSIEIQVKSRESSDQENSELLLSPAFNKKENMDYLELEKQAIGVSLPPLKSSDFRIVRASEEFYAPLRKSTHSDASVLVEDSSPKKFLIYPTQPAPKEICIEDYSNRPASPRIDALKPKLKSIKPLELVTTAQTVIPQVPVQVKSSNPFQLSGSMDSSKKNQSIEDSFHGFSTTPRIQVFAENSIKESLDAQDPSMNSYQTEMNISSDKLNPVDINQSPFTLTFRNNEEFNAPPQDLDSFINNFIPNPSIYNPSIIEDQFVSKYNRVEIPDIETGYHRSISPVKTSRDYSPDPLNRSIERNRNFTPSPGLKIHNKAMPSNFNHDRLLVPSIRESLTNSVIFSQNSRSHLLRKSPQRLPQTLFEKNLQGLLTREEELKITSNFS